MSRDIRFQAMTESDLGAVLEIERAAFSHPWSHALFLDGVKRYDCWLMFVDDRQVGHGVVQVVAGEASLLNITVAPDYQHQGLGLCLLEHLMERARARKAVECFLEVRASNQAAYRLYERFGFNEVGRRPDYYPAVGGREDAIVMVCPLED